jgi:hypothetical protein
MAGNAESVFFVERLAAGVAALSPPCHRAKV